MIRFMLALLAALTGLAAGGVPVQARVCAGDASAIGAVDCEDRADVALVAAAPMRRVEPGLADKARLPAPRAYRTVAVPTVMLGPDRAHE